MKKIILLILSVLNAVASAVYIAMSPVDIVPSHYNIMGEADAYSSKWSAMLMPCVLVLLSAIYFARCIYAKKAKSEDYEENKEFKIVVVIFALFVVLFWYLNIVCVSGKINIADSLGPVLNISMGVLFIYLSNMFGKTKQNRVFGIRLSSTLNSKYVWKKTHRLGGYLGVIAGFIMTILGIISLLINKPTPLLLPISLGIFIVLAVIIPIIYSYILYAKEKKSK